MRVNTGFAPAFPLAAAIAAALAFAQPAAAAQVPVDFTVHETLPALSLGRIVRGSLEHCAGATVKTTRAGGSEGGGVSTFNGSKKIDCGAGNTLTLAFKVQVAGCQKTNSGSWQVIRGTGVFASTRGQGRLVGTYTYRNGPGTFCKADGIDDRYTGKLQNEAPPKRPAM